MAVKIANKVLGSEYSYGKVNGVKRGVVKEVKNIDGLNKVVVNLPDDGIELPPADVSSTFAHKKTGVTAIPSENDEVLVSFVSGNINDPVILGSIYNAENSPPLSVNKDNTEIGITFPSGKASDGKKGLEIKISCESKKQNILITTEKGHIINVDDDKENIEIKEKSGKTSFMIDFKNGKITMKAEKTISMAAGKNEFTLDSNKGASIKCNGDFEASANNVKLESKANTDINAKAKMTLKSSGPLEASGATGKINASGPLELKGAITKIN